MTSPTCPGDVVVPSEPAKNTRSPGHVGLVIGHGEMIEAYATGFPIRISRYGPGGAAGDTNPVGFSRPWTHSGVRLTSLQTGG